MSNNLITLAWFDRDWERWLEKPEDFLFGISMINIIEYLHDYYQNKGEIKNKSFNKELMKILHESVKKKSIESRIISYCFPQSIISLAHPLQANIDIKSINSTLENIRRSYKMQKFFRGVKKELFPLLGNQNARQDLNIVLTHLVRSLLIRFSSKYLKTLPKNIFVKQFFNENRSKILSNLKKNKELSSETKKLLELLLNKSIKNAKKLHKSSSNKKFLNSLFYSYKLWESHTYLISGKAQHDLKNNNSVIQILKQQNWKNRNKLSAELCRKSKTKAPEFIQTIIEKICFNVIFECLDYPKILNYLSQNNYSKTFSSVIKEAVYKPNEISEFENFNFIAADSAIWSFINVYNNIISQKINKKFNKKLKRKYYDCLADYIIKNNESNNYFLTETKKKWNQCIDQFKFECTIIQFSRDCADEIIHDSLLAIQNDKISKTVKVTKNEFENIRNDKFFENLSGSYFSKIPDLSISKAKKLFNSLFQEFVKPDTEYRVICLIGGMDCNGKSFQIENVTFYDPRIWQYREGQSFDLVPGSQISIGENFRSDFSIYETARVGRHKIERKRNSARAYIDLEAPDQYSAIKTANISVRKALNTLVYASTSKQNHRGFKPQIPIDFTIIDKSKVFAGHSRGPRNDDFETLSIDTDYEKITKFYEQLSKESRIFNNQLFRALDWYHRGYWAETDHAKFVCYWIALEQLILKQLPKKKPKNISKLDQLLKYIPKLTIHWRKGYSGYAIKVYLSGITQAITKHSKLKKFLNSTSEFTGWEKNYSILLEHLDLLEPQTTGEARKCVNLLQKELLPNEIQEFKTLIQNLRSYEKFKIARLYAKRNQLIHEGITYSQELEIMTKVLEKLLIDTIDTHLNFRHEKNINKIIYQANRPIHVRDRWHEL